MSIMTTIKKAFSHFIEGLKEEQRKEMETIRMGKDYVDEDDDDEYSYDPIKENCMFRYGPLDSPANPYSVIFSSDREDREFRRTQEALNDHYDRYCRLNNTF